MRNSAWALLVVIVTGCHTTVGSIRARFATETGCPSGEVDVLASGGTLYRARGCGKEVTYVCESATMSETDVRRCAEEDRRPSRSPGEREHVGLPPPDPRVQMP
ncbi:MAG TPA: hypothetical protein VHE30_28755 [Polyangiaceae bacterium]|nr:hypothetical protein [Polyangiaceae bacterium]